MKAFTKAILAALMVELVCAGLLFLGRGGFLDRFHLGVLTAAATILHLPGALFFSGSWGDTLHPVVGIGSVLVANWLSWTLIVYVFLLVRTKLTRNTIAESSAPPGGDPPLRSDSPGAPEEPT